MSEIDTHGIPPLSVNQYDSDRGGVLPIVIAEHSQNIYHLEELPKDKINIIEFTEDESHGRYGFIPGLTNEIISGR